MPNFTEALSKKASEVEKPKPKPAGTYLSMIQGMPSVKEVNTKEGPREVLSFKAKPIQAVGDDIDQEALAEHDPVNQWMPQSIDFWDGEQGEFQAKQFLINVLGIEPGEGKNEKTLGEMCSEAAGKQLLTTYENYPYQSKEGTPEIGTRIKAGGMAKA